MAKSRVRARKGQPVAHWNAARRDWETRITLPAEPGQTRQRKWIRAKTEEGCLAKVRVALSLLAGEVALPDDSGTLGQVARQWLAYMEGRVSQGSWVAYRTRVNNHILPMLGSRRLTALRTQDVDQFQKDLEAKGLAFTTRKEIRSTLVIIIQWAQARDMVTRNVAALSAGPRGGSGKPVDTLTQAQAEELLERVSGWRLESAVVLMLMTGLRIGEALGLRWSDITGSSLTVAGQLVTKPSLHYQPFPKTSSGYRTITIPQKALAALGTPGEGYVFQTASGGFIDPSTLAMELKQRTRAMGVNVHPHLLRHTAASLMLDAGVPLETVSKVLGHKSIRTTADIYGHLLDRGRDAAASAMERMLG